MEQIDKIDNDSMMLQLHTLKSQLTNIKMQHSYERQFHSASRKYSLHKALVSNSELFTHDIDRFQNTLHGLVISANGTDPHFIVPEFINSEGHVEVLCKVVVHAPKQTTLVVYYTTVKSKEFDYRKSEHYFNDVGRNEIYLRIQADSPIMLIRLDPGEVPGEYLVEHFEIRV